MSVTSRAGHKDAQHCGKAQYFVPLRIITLTFTRRSHSAMRLDLSLESGYLINY